MLQRKIVFSRTSLMPHGQTIYDVDGNVATDVHYGEFKDYGLPFPSLIQIWRPGEEYSITLAMLKVTLNQPLTDEQFALTQPPGAQVVQLDRNVRASDGGH
jgi:outer membrane lipoprotein-sorting protein